MHTLARHSKKQPLFIHNKTHFANEVFYTFTPRKLHFSNISINTGESFGRNTPETMILVTSIGVTMNKTNKLSPKNIAHHIMRVYTQKNTKTSKTKQHEQTLTFRGVRASVKNTSFFVIFLLYFS